MLNCKRILAGLLAATTVFSATACNSNTDTTSSTGEQTTICLFSLHFYSFFVFLLILRSKIIGIAIINTIPALITINIISLISPNSRNGTLGFSDSESENISSSSGSPSLSKRYPVSVFSNASLLSPSK